MKEIPMKLLKIIEHTFRNTTYSKARFRFTKQISIISIAPKMGEADYGNLPSDESQLWIQLINQTSTT